MPKWYAISAEEAVNRLESNAAVGLSHKVARLRYGKKKIKGEGDLFYREGSGLRTVGGLIASDVLLWILLLTCSALSFFADTRLAFVGIVFLALNISVSLGVAAVSCGAAEELSLAFVPSVKVIREGKLLSVDYRFVIPGDIVLLSEGDLVLFDARLLSSEQLRVSVCCGHDREGSLRFEARDKEASATLNPRRDLSPEDRTNMVTAGSVILHGTARAIVVETGLYTYIGALLGGLPLHARREAKYHFVRSVCRKLRYIGVLFLTLSIPLTAVSLVGGTTARLASSFLTVLSLSVTFFPGWIVAVLDCMAIRAIRKMKTNGEALVRSAQVSDTLAETDVVALLGKSMLSDGLPHVAEIFSEGKGYVGKALRSDACRRLTARAAFLALTESELPYAGAELPDRTVYARKELLAFAEFLGVEREMMRIRFQKTEYRAPSEVRPITALRYTDASDGGMERILLCSKDPSFYMQCTHIRIGDTATKISPAWQLEISKRIRECTGRGWEQYFYAERASDGKIVFLGYISYAELFSKDTRKTVTEMEQQGIKVLLFLNGESVSDRYFAAASGCVKAECRIALSSDFAVERRNLLDTFGLYDAYLGFSNAEIAAFLERLRETGRTVCGVALNGIEADLLAETDVSIACGEIRSTKRFQPEQALAELPISGVEYGTEAPGTVRFEADAVVHRCSKTGGGLPALQRMLMSCRRIKKTQSGFLSYLALSLALRAGMLLPLLFGFASLDFSAALLFSGLVIDLFAGIAFAYDGKRASDEETQAPVPPKHSARRRCLGIAVALIIGVLLSLLPLSFSWFGAEPAAELTASFRSAALFLALLSVWTRVRYCIRKSRVDRVSLAFLLPMLLAIISGLGVRRIGVLIGIAVFPEFSLAFLPITILLPWSIPIEK